MVNMVTGVWRDSIGAVLVSVHNATNPSVAEWNNYVAQGGPTMHSGGVALSFTDGGSPNVNQRAQVTAASQGLTTLPCSVVSDSILVRGVVTALSWFNDGIAVFPPGSVNQAFMFINVGPRRSRPLWDFVRQLHSKLDPPGSTIAKAEPHLDWNRPLNRTF